MRGKSTAAAAAAAAVRRRLSPPRWCARSCPSHYAARGSGERAARAAERARAMRPPHTHPSPRLPTRRALGTQEQPTLAGDDSDTAMDFDGELGGGQ